ncbi:S-adenosyl-L-methionine-dependentmethyltransferases superfamily protein, partial [Striga asiatica]
METRPNPKGRIKRYEPIEQILFNPYTPSAHSSSDEPPHRRSHPENMFLSRVFIHFHHPITRASLPSRQQQTFSYRQKLRLQVAVPPRLLAKRIVPQNNAVFVMMALNFFLKGAYDGLMVLEVAVNSHKVRVFVQA